MLQEAAGVGQLPPTSALPDVFQGKVVWLAGSLPAALVGSSSQTVCLSVSGQLVVHCLMHADHVFVTG